MDFAMWKLDCPLCPEELKSPPEHYLNINILDVDYRLFELGEKLIYNDTRKPYEKFKYDLARAEKLEKIIIKLTQDDFEQDEKITPYTMIRNNFEMQKESTALQIKYLSFEYDNQLHKLFLAFQFGDLNYKMCAKICYYLMFVLDAGHSMQQNYFLSILCILKILKHNDMIK